MTTKMYSRTARLATYDKPLKLSKKRASSQAKKKSHTPSWPHDTPTPDMLARAGFYFEPDDSEGDDNVKCFSCRANLNGWEPEDNPAKEHISHRPDCNWAIVIAVASPDEARNPLCQELLEARIETYNRGPEWPHQGRCDVQHMAEAGFALDCDDENTDGATCHYCGVQLSGWEPEDNPWKEHQRRQPDCRFFELVDMHREQPLTKKAKTSRKRATSKTSRASIQSTISNVVSERADDEVDELSSEETTERAPSVKRTKGTRPRKNTKSHLDQSEVIQPQSIDNEKSTKKLKKPTKKAAKVSVQPQDNEQVIGAGVAETDEPAEPRAAKKQRTTKGAKASTSKTSAVRVSNASAQLQDELDESLLSLDVSTKGISRAERGVKRKSDGSVVDSDVSTMAVDFPLPPISTAQQAKAHSQVSQKQLREQTSASTFGMQDEDERMIELELARIEAEQHQREAKSKKPPASIKFEILQDEVDAEQIDLSSNRHKTPDASPSGSDKENTLSSFDQDIHPQRDKPASTSSAKPTRIPLAPSTPNRSMAVQRVGTVSPSKKLLGISKSSQPWIPIDIENVLLVSSAATPLRDQLVNQAGTLTAAERSMSVEAWIRARASQAESELQRRGEEMVSVFEREGNRALSSLHGMSVAQ